MALVLKSIYKFYSYANEELSDPRVRDWPLMNNPLIGSLIIAGYLYFVLNKGPKLMAFRAKFEFKKFIIVYNAFQIVACALLAIGFFKDCYLERYNLLCESVDFSSNPRPLRIASYVYYYHLLKILDLIDTVLFVLRKKQNQVSFLHVYHHSGMVALTWGATKFQPGGHTVFICFINSLVHMIMYTYYLLTAVNDEYKKSIWWKKHLTQLQIIQFFLVFLHFLSLIFNHCGYPRWVVIVLVPQNLFIFALFVDFYYQTYIKKEKTKKLD